MKSTHITTLALGLLLLATPFALRAEEGNDDSTDASVTVSAEAGTGSSMEDSRSRTDMLYRLKNQFDQIRPEIKARMELQASTSRPSGEDQAARLEQKQERVAEKTGERLEKADERVDHQIEKLQEQIARVALIERLSAEQKAKITAELTAQLDRLVALKASIATETDPAVIKEQAKEVASAFRAHALSLPRAAITATADRMMKVVAQMEAFSVKLHTRVDAAASAEASASLSAFDAKVADAKAKAQAAASIVADLSADAGDEAAMKANAEALQSAKAKLDAGHADLKAAREDIGDILKAVKGLGEKSDS